MMSSLQTHAGKTVISKSNDNRDTTLKGTMLLKTLSLGKRWGKQEDRGKGNWDCNIKYKLIKRMF